jgi:hypothetical protein
MVLPALVMSSETVVLQKYSVSILKYPNALYNFAAICPDRAAARSFLVVDYRIFYQK